MNKLKELIKNKMLHVKRLQYSFTHNPTINKIIRPFLPYINTFYRSLFPVSNPPKNFWKINLDDIKCFFLMASTTISVWFVSSLTGSSSSVVCYWDGPNYVFAGITLYDISRDNPWTRSFNYNPSYFACHLPGFPLLIRFCAFFTIGNYLYADYLAIIVSGLLLCYSFRRVLIIYGCVDNPLYTTLLLSIFPMRLFIYHSVGASEPLFISYVCLSLIFYKFDQFLPMLFSVWGGCITRIEGMAIGATIGACYLLRLEILKALSMFLTFVSTFCLMILHRAMFDDPFAYIKFNSGQQGLIQLRPLHEIRGGNSRSRDVLYLHSFIDFYFLYVIGLIPLFFNAGPIAIYSFIHLAYVSLLRHMDVFRYSLSAAVFCLLVGFDRMWSDRRVRSAMYYFAPFYFVFLLSYATGQIHSNRCGDDFWRQVLDAAKDNMH